MSDGFTVGADGRDCDNVIGVDIDGAAWFKVTPGRYVRLPDGPVVTVGVTEMGTPWANWKDWDEMEPGAKRRYLLLRLPDDEDGDG